MTTTESTTAAAALLDIRMVIVGPITIVTIIVIVTILVSYCAGIKEKSSRYTHDIPCMEHFLQTAGPHSVTNCNRLICAQAIQLRPWPNAF